MGFHRSDSQEPTGTQEKVMAHNPLAEDEILSQFYRGLPQESSSEKTNKPRPMHYKVICISLYKEDLDKLDRAVAALKQRGHTKANKSQVLRAALDQLNLDLIPNAR